MTDLVQKLVGALDGQISRHKSALMLLRCDDEFIAKQVADAEAALSAAKDGGWVAVPVEPVAWMRKWAHEGETPQKTRNENGRMAWPAKFKFLPVTQGKCMSDDVPLYAPLPNPPKEQA